MSHTRWGFARKAANKIVFMADGQILERGTPDEFFEHPPDGACPGVPVEDSHALMQYGPCTPMDSVEESGIWFVMHGSVKGER